MTTDAWAYRVTGLDLETVSDALTLGGIETAGLSEDGFVTTVWFTERPDDALPVEGVWEYVRQTDWSQEWKRGLTPVTVGRVTILPAADAVADPAGGADHIVLVIEPGLAFGTGHHETTTGCLQALQAQDLRGRHVVDIGTGTGVLALAARALGAARVTGVDLDPQAIEVAQANVAAHDLDQISLRVGSCAEVEAAGDVVVANIITDLLLAIAEDLVALLAPGGTVITSGVAVGREAEAVHRFERLGVTMAVTSGAEWAVLVGHRAGEVATARGRKPNAPR
ncbi:50S ribosomal protein L11 methyltransferase [Euzebya tangerina]|uniref:50S ribosomal protein L11 methyltransferase n=1 Tax=Euzebya tangerina TaxID=591198 RepID=UPI000E31EE46|nr:50S ribosomal protein L11 methyltransferase [Euzebya tangerina]